MTSEGSDHSSDPLREILGLLGHLASTADPVILAGLGRLSAAVSQAAGLRASLEGLRAEIARIEQHTAESVRLLAEIRDLLGDTPSPPDQG